MVQPNDTNSREPAGAILARTAATIATPKPVTWAATEKESLDVPWPYLPTFSKFRSGSEPNADQFRRGTAPGLVFRDAIAASCSAVVLASAVAGRYAVLGESREQEKVTLAGLHPPNCYAPEEYAPVQALPPWVVEGLRLIRAAVLHAAPDLKAEHDPSLFHRDSGTNVGWPFLTNGDREAAAVVAIIRAAEGRLPTLLEIGGSVAEGWGVPVKPFYVRFARDRQMGKPAPRYVFHNGVLCDAGLMHGYSWTRQISAGALIFNEPARPASKLLVRVLKRLFPAIMHKYHMASWLSIAGRGAIDGVNVVEMDYSRYDSTIQDAFVAATYAIIDDLNKQCAWPGYRAWDLRLISSLTLSLPLMAPSCYEGERVGLYGIRGIRSGDMATSAVGILFGIIVALRAWAILKGASLSDAFHAAVRNEIPIQLYGDDGRMIETSGPGGLFSTCFEDAVGETTGILKSAPGGGFLRSVGGAGILGRILRRRFEGEWPTPPLLRNISDYAALGSCLHLRYFQTGWACFNELRRLSGIAPWASFDALRVAAIADIATLNLRGPDGLTPLGRYQWNPGIAAEFEALGLDVTAGSGTLSHTIFTTHDSRDDPNEVINRVVNRLPIWQKRQWMLKQSERNN